MIDDRTNRRRKRISSIAQAYRDSHEVMSAALSVAVFVGGGYWLDQKYGYLPVLTIAGMILGSLMAIASLRQLLARLDKRSKDQRRKASSMKTPGGSSNDQPDGE